jgi:hypothetical protein
VRERKKVSFCHPRELISVPIRRYYHSLRTKDRCVMVLSNFGFDGWKMSTSRVNLDLNHILVAGRVCFALSRARIRHDLQLIKLIPGEKICLSSSTLVAVCFAEGNSFFRFSLCSLFFRFNLKAFCMPLKSAKGNFSFARSFRRISFAWLVNI